VFIGLALFVTCVAGVWHIQHLQANMTGVLTQNVRSLEAAHKLEGGVRREFENE
jgi:hypothetical protein